MGIYVRLFIWRHILSDIIVMRMIDRNISRHSCVLRAPAPVLLAGWSFWRVTYCNYYKNMFFFDFYLPALVCI